MIDEILNKVIELLKTDGYNFNNWLIESKLSNEFILYYNSVKTDVKITLEVRVNNTNKKVIGFWITKNKNKTFCLLKHEILMEQNVLLGRIIQCKENVLTLLRPYINFKQKHDG